MEYSGFRPPRRVSRVQRKNAPAVSTAMRPMRHTSAAKLVAGWLRFCIGWGRSLSGRHGRSRGAQQPDALLERAVLLQAVRPLAIPHFVEGPGQLPQGGPVLRLAAEVA